MAPHARGEGVECGAEGSDLVGEAGEGAAGGGAVTVLLDDAPDHGVPVESGAAEAGMGGNGGESHCLSVPEELGAGALDAVEGARVGHPAVASLISLSSLLRVFYLSGLSALKSSPASRTYYDRKRVEGKSHIQAMLSLARRRLNVLWAMLRDGTTYTPVPVPTAGSAA